MLFAETTEGVHQSVYEDVVSVINAAYYHTSHHILPVEGRREKQKCAAV